MFLRDSSPVMEKLAERFPHLLELILSRLDDPTLENSRLVSKSWRNFVDWFWLVKQLRIYKTKTLGNKSLILLHEDWRKFFLHLESDLEALRLTHCLKITQNVAFEFLNFGIFHQFLSY